MMPGPQLRDIHLPPEPGGWPPTLATTLVLAVGLVLLGLLLAWCWRRLAARRRAQALARFFDQQVASARNEDERIQRASACLRRVVARRHPGVVAATGPDWLEVLDAGDPAHPFSRGPGRLLAEGPFRGSLQPGEAQAAIALARVRFLQWGGAADA